MTLSRWASQPRKTRQRLKKGSNTPKVNSHDTSTLSNLRRCCAFLPPLTIEPCPPSAVNVSRTTIQYSEPHSLSRIAASLPTLFSPLCCSSRVFRYLLYFSQEFLRKRGTLGAITTWLALQLPSGPATMQAVRPSPESFTFRALTNY